MVTHVYIYLQILHVHCIDSTNETLSAKFYFRATWLQNKPDDWESVQDQMKEFCDDNSKFPKGITDPQISFDNSMGVMELKDQSLQVSKFREPTNDDRDDRDEKIVIEYRARGSGTFIQSLSFQHFPFDIQFLKINMASMNPYVQLHDDCYDDVESTMRRDYFVDTGFVPITLNTTKDRIEDINGHHEQRGPFLNTVIPEEVNKDGEERGVNLRSVEEKFWINHRRPQKKPFHLLSYVIPARRISRHAKEEMFLPVFLITTAAFTSYGFAPEDLSKRLSTSVSLALVITAYKYLAATTSVPVLKDRTVCDLYILISFVIIFLVVFQNWVAGLIACEGFCKSDDSSDFGEIFDIVSFSLLGVLWVVLNIRTVVHVKSIQKKDAESFKNRFKEIEKQRVNRLQIRPDFHR
mmetsp:Transcript_9977/g.11958  ORF Transcript_9977/g.11958 Transcript_9977/m.11958 type:complete len:408 (+) Transcript_9977:143-1366(+)|eukprot:CAMPEP_0195292160 /NCGR_PEP_ID=MMETSP0707-20130614/8647_1 /TAXON_ID=33640 /ORGANISM="Asterionellopsis glacialis, Strain CCMP134" /LENGTH=407 /DNA_ID=CAMNT_0040352557 /DNA_START=161 /DNA_END=1384 /DNA_ORIENTATION=+